jgi:type II secretory pathway pseudopilin PulG
MKKILISSLIGLIIGALVVFLVLHKSVSQDIESFEKNSFYEVTSKLNNGGNFYLYFSTEKVIKLVDDFIIMARQMVETQMSKSQIRNEEGLKTFDFVVKLLKNSGIMDVSGIGMSSISIDKSLNHSRFVIHHYPDKGEGLIWNLMDEKPHELSELKLLPDDTVLAGFADFKLKTLWQWIKKEADESELPKLKQGIGSVEPLMKKQEIDFTKLLDSIDGRIGFVLSMDQEKTISVPMGKNPVNIPEPAIVIVFSVNDSYVFDLLKDKLKLPLLPEKENINALQIPVPKMPFPLKPVIVQDENQLFFASNIKVVEDMLEARKSGKGLTSTDEFKKLSKYIPEKGNSFRYLSSRFFNLILALQKKAFKESPGMKNQNNVGSDFFKLFPKDLSLFGVGQNTDEGMIFTFNHSLNFEYIALIPAITSAGIIAAIATPNFIVAMQKGKQKATMGDLKSIGMAIESYIADKKEAPQGQSLEEIKNKLQPFYIKKLPLKDGWGYDFLYKAGTGDKNTSYYLGSGGKDGIFSGWDQNGFYLVAGSSDFNQDIIFTNGAFTFGPKMK